MTFETFHGSPGSPKDFAQLENLLGGQWIHHDRLSRPRALQPGSVLVGYSWGCRELFRKIETQPLLHHRLILISPFLFTAPSSGILKILIKTPLVGRLLTGILGSSIIEKFVKSSSSPQTPNALYLNQRATLKSHQHLKLAVSEKDNFQLTTWGLSCPVLVIWGEGDQTSSYEKQIEPLAGKLESLKIQTVPASGHALPWNQAQQVSELIAEFLSPPESQRKFDRSSDRKNKNFESRKLQRRDL